MSRKSGFSNSFPLESPSIDGELPHHPQAFSGGGPLEVRLVPLLGEFPNMQDSVSSSHTVTVPFLTVTEKSDNPRSLLPKTCNLLKGMCEL